MTRVFISYSRKNASFAERLARDLNEAGLETWIDFRKIQGGEVWREAIFKGIAQAEVIVVCLSPEAVESEWVRREIFMAQSQQKRIIPVMVVACLELMSAHDETSALLDVLTSISWISAMSYRSLNCYRQCRVSVPHRERLTPRQFQIHSKG